MQRKYLMIIIGCVGMAVSLLLLRLGSQSTPVAPPPVAPLPIAPVAIENAQITIAAKKIPKDTAITHQLITFKPFPLKEAQADWIKKEEIFDKNVIGMIAHSDIEENSPLLLSALENPANLSLIDMIQPGKRAMTLPFTTRIMVTTSIKSGMYVDVIIAKTDKQPANTIIENVRVLEIISSGNQSAGLDGGSITLEIDPTDTEKLAEALVNSSISLVLHGRSNQADENSQKNDEVIIQRPATKEIVTIK